MMIFDSVEICLQSAIIANVWSQSEQISAFRTLMPTTVEILFFISTCMTPENQLLKVKCAFNIEALIYIRT